MISRDYYLNQLIKHMWNGEIKVITGIRRSGKSVLLFNLFKEYLIKQGVLDKHILTYSLDQRKYAKYRNPIKLSEEIEAIVNHSEEKYYLFIDEIQMSIITKQDDDQSIEITIYELLNEFKAYTNLDVYVTGSNSKMLSKDIMTEFRGRSTQIHIFPFSFNEFYDFRKGNKQEALNEYMLYGGMPRLLYLDNDVDKKNYLKTLYDEVYIKDIIERNRLDKPYIMEHILDYLSSQIGSLTNPTNIANALTHETKEKVTHEIVSRYMDYIEDAYLLSKARRYDIKGKSYFKYPNKYYFSDLGIRNSRLNFRQFDPGHLMENLIYNELIRRGYSVDVGVVVDRTNKLNKQKEIDFIVNFGDKRVYIQSALRIEHFEKEDTELYSFRLTGDFFKKIVIRNDIFHNYNDDNGFFHCSLLDFLLEKIELF